MNFPTGKRPVSRWSLIEAFEVTGTCYEARLYVRARDQGAYKFELYCDDELVDLILPYDTVEDCRVAAVRQARVSCRYKAD